jgi:hypothetical protein
MSERKSIDPKVGEEPRKEPAIEEPAQKDIRQKQNVPHDLEKKEPIQRKEEIKIKPEKREVEPKPTQKEKELKPNVPMDNRGKEQPVQPKKQAAPQPVPIQREQPERRQEPKQQNVQPKASPNVVPRVAEPKQSVNPPTPVLPRTEQKTKQKPRDK